MTVPISQGFSPGINEDRVGGRGLGGVCVHINHLGYHKAGVEGVGGHSTERAWGEHCLSNDYVTHKHCQLVSEYNILSNDCRWDLHEVRHKT